MAEKPPDPNGEMPTDWNPLQWLAYQRIATGAHSYAEVGNMIGRSRGTVGNWVNVWRRKYGYDLFRDPPMKRAQMAGSHASGRASSQRWADIRAVTASGYGATANTAIELAHKVLGAYLEDTEEARAKRAELTPSDIWDLARTADILAKRADQLAGIPDASRQYVVDNRQVVLNTNDTNEEVFARLDAAAKEGGTVEMLAQIEETLSEYQTFVSTDPRGDVIDLNQ